MALREDLELLRDDVRELASDKDATIDPLRLSAELDRIVSNSDASKEHVWRKYNRRMELWKEARLEMMRAVITFGQGAIRTLVLVNGAAAIAVLTFLGSYTEQGDELFRLLTKALLLFAFGVVAASLVAGFAYLAQLLYDSNSKRLEKVGFAFHVLSVLIAATGLALFVAGLLSAYQGFLTQV
ncbi:hypothetical protein [uncultured Tateyamaria sp.]|uniref:hypothetical protein n=1 Tax=uncultured Tateyamaria sp. TaxID=455651 RepID=UPI002619EFC9|nr:hypothetical protein [uncultured Tateyamaria sp.]